MLNLDTVSVFFSFLLYTIFDMSDALIDPDIKKNIYTLLPRYLVIKVKCIYRLRNFKNTMHSCTKWPGLKMNDTNTYTRHWVSIHEEIQRCAHWSNPKTQMAGRLIHRWCYIVTIIYPAHTTNTFHKWCYLVTIIITHTVTHYHTLVYKLEGQLRDFCHIISLLMNRFHF